MLDRITKNFGSPEEMKKQIEAHGQTLDQVKNDIRGSIRQEHWIEAQIKGKADVTDAEAEDFYKKNPEKFRQPEEVRASHILVATPEDAKPEVIAEKQKQAQALAERVKKGEDFNKLAEQLSEDPSAKENKGDLGFFGKGQMVPEFSDAAFAMKKGDISDPVRSKFGFHIIKVTDRKDAGTVTLAQAKPQQTQAPQGRRRDGQSHQGGARLGRCEVGTGAAEYPRRLGDSAPGSRHHRRSPPNEGRSRERLTCRAAADLSLIQ